MNEVKLALKNLWKAIVKLVLSKTTVDEKLADKVEALNEKMKNIDLIDNNTEVKKTKTKKK